MQPSRSVTSKTGLSSGALYISFGTIWPRISSAIWNAALARSVTNSSADDLLHALLFPGGLESVAPPKRRQLHVTCGASDGRIACRRCHHYHFRPLCVSSTRSCALDRLTALSLDAGDLICSGPSGCWVRPLDHAPDRLFDRIVGYIYGLDRTLSGPGSQRTPHSSASGNGNVSPSIAGVRVL